MDRRDQDRALFAGDHDRERGARRERVFGRLEGRPEHEMLDRRRRPGSLRRDRLDRELRWFLPAAGDREETEQRQGRHETAKNTRITSWHRAGILKSRERGDMRESRIIRIRTWLASDRVERFRNVSTQDPRGIATFAIGVATGHPAR